MGTPHTLGTHRLVGWGTGVWSQPCENFTKALCWALGLGGGGGCCQGEKVAEAIQTEDMAGWLEWGGRGTGTLGVPLGGTRRVGELLGLHQG